MAADDFTLEPNVVTELEPIYNTISTDSESMKKEYLNLSTTPVEQYELKFKALSTANKDTLIAHYKARYGGYDSFAWTSVPAYIGSGSNITGRWIPGSLKISPIGNSLFTCSINFEKDN